MKYAISRMKMSHVLDCNLVIQRPPTHPGLSLINHWICYSRCLNRFTIIGKNQQLFKGKFSDFHNNFFWHESEDINQKSLFPKFQLIPILHFQVMHDY